MHDIRKTVFLATSNYPEKLGSRITNRPSRFDKKIFIGMPSSEAREVFIRSKLINENDEEIEKWIGDTEGFSIAHIKELFVANKILGDPYPQALDILRKMKMTPISTSFDDHEIVDHPIDFGMVKLGSGEAYAEAKKRLGDPLLEDIDRISGLISEDI
jgi:hypothetical protein